MTTKSLHASVIAATLLAACAAHAQDIVRIGHAGPLTGSIAHLGKDTEHGVRLAIEDINRSAPRIGGRAVRFEMLSQDDAADPKQATSVAHLLVDRKVAGVVGHLTSGASIPASFVYARAGIPQITPSATNPKLTQAGHATTFRLVATDLQVGAALGTFAHRSLGARTAAVIDDRTAFGQGLADEFARSFSAAGGAVVAREYTSDKATDFTAILTRVRALDPDIVFYGGVDAQAGPLIRQMRQLGIRAQTLAGDGACTAELPRLSGGAIGDERHFCAEAGGIPTSMQAANDAFRRRYKAATGTDVSIYAPKAFDATHMLVEAMKMADSTDPARYLPALARLKYRGVSGVYEFKPNGDLKAGVLTLYTYRGGRREELRVIH